MAPWMDACDVYTFFLGVIEGAFSGMDCSLEEEANDKAKFFFRDLPRSNLSTRLYVGSAIDGCAEELPKLPGRKGCFKVADELEKGVSLFACGLHSDSSMY